MYDYRKWTPEKQTAALKERVARRFPFHSPPHVAEPDAFRIITGACFEHQAVLQAPGGHLPHFTERPKRSNELVK